MRLQKFFTTLLVASLAYMAAPLHAREAPRMVALSTGSNIATWTLPATPAVGTRVHTTPVVYLHGGPGMYTEDRRIEMGQAFRTAGFTTVYYDQIGGGQSARIPASGYNLARMIGDLEALRISLGVENLVLWGNSWGAQLAVLYGQAYPGRVAAFVLTSPGGFPGENFRRDYKGTKRTSVTIGRELTAAINQIDRKGGGAEASVSQVDGGRLFDAVVSADMLEGMVCKASTLTQAPLPGGGNLYTNRIVPKEVASARRDWTTMSRVPSLVVRGSCDFLPVTSADRYVAVTGGRRVDLAGIGHGLLENPALVEQTLGDFVRSNLSNVP